jgi:hypothetical protein
MERDSGDRESPAQRHADTAVVGLVPDDLGPDCVGIDDQPVVKGLAGDISDDLEDCRLVAGKGSGVKIDVSGWTSRVVRGHEHAAFERESSRVLGGGKAT